MVLAALGLLLLAMPVSATVVNAVVKLPDGSLANGRAIISLIPGPCIGPGGAIILSVPRAYPITNGNLSVDLVPSTTCSPTRVYKVEFQVQNANLPPVNWAVPTSGPVDASAIQTGSVPITIGSIGLGFITGGLAKGDMVVYNGNQFIRVPAGNPGERLEVDLTTASGVAWKPATGGSGGPVYGRYSGTLASSSTWTIPGTTHALGTCAVLVQTWVSNQLVEPDTVACNSTSFAITVTFTQAVAGDIFITSDPALTSASFPPSGSLVSSIVSAPFTPSSTLIQIDHFLGAVVMVRCYDSAGASLFWDNAIRLNSNQLTVSFVGTTPGGFCIAAR